MKLKTIILAVFLLGCVFIAITGAADYAKNRVQLQQEKMKNKELAALGLETQGAEEELKIKMLWSAALLLTGGLGIFLFIYRSTKKNRYTLLTNNRNKSKQV